MDIKLFRVEAGGNPDLIKESQRRRCSNVHLVDEIIDLDRQWRDALSEENVTRASQKNIGKRIAAAKKAGESIQDIVKEGTELKQRIAELSQIQDDLLTQRDEKMYQIGNIVHDSVPISDNEDDNITVRTFGEFEQGGFDKHHNLLYRIGAYNSEKGIDIAGHRGYFLTGPGIWLNQALINYGLQFLHKKGYTELQTPFFMKKSTMKAVSQLEDFEETLYKLPAKNNNDQENGAEDKFLIATAEQPLCAFHKNEIMQPKELPIHYAGYSTCFRKEAGKHGKDIRGIFRVHQFEKVEQFIICGPDDSWDIHEKLMETTEEFYQSLEIPYRVVAIVSGDLNNAAAKKYDLEAWFPGQETFRELVSNSNCTDYQSRRLHILYGPPSQDKRTFVHMLNCTLVATERALCCLAENYQCEEGIRVPEVLQPYMAPYLDDPTLIPFVREALEE
eukprot:TRINITY_DN2597_c0_g1_i1.p1 TRINITY_DN2597_c0_g1~~TRINITY_DN2597_c0_g1_i1.p1  ORF type:complete len:446 (-),score=133.82 TRINITY_DN2597_c0_g1_i1:43-1380(-)